MYVPVGSGVFGDAPAVLTNVTGTVGKPGADDAMSGATHEICAGDADTMGQSKPPSVTLSEPSVAASQTTGGHSDAPSSTAV